MMLISCHTKDIYSVNFPVSDIPASKITNLVYAFSDVNNVTGEVTLSDPWADLEKIWPSDVQESGNNVYGNVKQLYLLKKVNRRFKTILSIGGWSYRENFPVPASTDSTRRTFAKSAVQLVKDLGFDGIDIDWEYPDGEANSNNFVMLLSAIREELDNYSRNLTGNPHFLLTSAVPAGPDHYKWLKLAEMNQYLDYFFLLAFDYAGPSFSNLTGDLANVYPSLDNPSSTPFNTEQAVNAYMSGGVPGSKIILGMPLYGREFNHTTGLGKPFNGTGPGDYGSAGVYDYKVDPAAST